MENCNRSGGEIIGDLQNDIIDYAENAYKTRTKLRGLLIVAVIVAISIGIFGLYRLADTNSTTTDSSIAQDH